MNRIVIIISILMFGLQAFSQSAKTVKNEKILSQTIKEYDYSSGNEKVNIIKYFRYDERGNEIELKEYDKNGKIKKHTESIYDEVDNEISRTYFYPNGKVKKVYKYVYEGKLRTEKTIYDEDGKLQIKREYIYEKVDDNDN